MMPIYKCLILGFMLWRLGSQLLGRTLGFRHHQTVEIRALRLPAGPDLEQLLLRARSADQCCSVLVFSPPMKMLGRPTLPA